MYGLKGYRWATSFRSTRGTRGDLIINVKKEDKNKYILTAVVNWINIKRKSLGPG